MKLRKTIINVLLIIVLTLVSCNNGVPTSVVEPTPMNEDVPTSVVEPTPLIAIEYSTPPIDLQGIDAKFAMDIPYDEHDETKFDIFLPNSLDPTGLVIFIHGGGFKSGDKDFVYEPFYASNIRDILSNNLAVATINYRLLTDNETEGVLKCLNDSKRALQHIRYIHSELNINKDDIALYGNSAGAGTSLWIATNNDMKDENNSDPVLRESTRLKGVALKETQATYDFERWFDDVFAEFGITWENYLAAVGEDELFQMYGINSWEEYDSPEIDKYRQKVNMLSLLSPDDPEIWIQNTDVPNGMPQTITNIYHHAFHAREIKEYLDAVGIANVCKYGNPALYSHPSNEGYIDFLIRKVHE